MARHRSVFFDPIIAALLAVMALASCSGFRGDRPSQGDALHRTLLETYVKALKTGDWARVMFAPGVTFEGPLSRGRIDGESEVRRFLAGVSAGVKDVRVERFVVDGDFACIVATLETKTGVAVPFCEVVEFVEGRIARLRPYFDPRQLLE